LSDHLEQGPVLLIFYRGDWWPSCNGQLASWPIRRWGREPGRDLGRPDREQSRHGRQAAAVLSFAQRSRGARDQTVGCLERAGGIGTTTRPTDDAARYVDMAERYRQAAIATFRLQRDRRGNS